MVCAMLMMSSSVMTARATSLDELVDSLETQDTGQQESTETEVENNVEVDETSDTSQNNDTVNDNSNSSDNGYVTSESFINSMKGATNFTQNNELTSKVNGKLNKIVTPIVQILAYAVTVLMVLRVVLDLAFITIPFSRKFLGNGYMGSVSIMNDQGMMGSPVGQPMGSPVGKNGMGMGMMGNAMNMNSMKPVMTQQPAISNRIQLVSQAALNAVAAENNPDGKAGTPLKIYAKDMLIVLVITPVLLILAMTGALMQVGFVIGDAITNALYNLGNMM